MDHIRVVPQRNEADCGVSCLAMLFGLTYEDAYYETATIDKHRASRGLYLVQLELIARKMGRKLLRRRKFDLDDAVGILNVQLGKEKSEHVVVIWDGKIFDTDGTVWDAETYLSVNQAKPLTLLIPADHA